MIVTSLTLLSKSLSSCDSHLHTNTDLLASWKFFWCVCVCVCGRARPFIVRGLTNPGTWFSHSTQPKQSGPWQRAAVKIQLLKETKGGRSKENQLSTPPPPVQPLAGNGHLLTCEQLRYYRASQTSGSNIIPTDSAALCCFDLVYTHTHLSSRASRASSILST